MNRLRATVLWVAVTACVSAAQAVCVGDCNGDGMVTVEEIEEALSLSAVYCAALDPDGDGEYFGNDISTAYMNAAVGCPRLRPDLVVTSVRRAGPEPAPPQGCYTTFFAVSVCIANRGQAPAGPFFIGISDSVTEDNSWERQSGLDVNAEICTRSTSTIYAGTATADPDNAVEEENEDNNANTMGDFAPLEGAYYLSCTATITPAATPTPTPTGTPENTFTPRPPKPAPTASPTSVSTGGGGCSMTRIQNGEWAVVLWPLVVGFACARRNGETHRTPPP